MKTILKPSREEFHRLASGPEGGNLIAVHAELVADSETPVSAFRKIAHGPYSFLLESAETHDQVGRYSFLGSDPAVIFRVDGTHGTIEEDGKTTKFEVTGDPLEALRLRMATYRVAGASDYPFTGGAVGFLSYDMVRHFEPSVPAAKSTGLGLPTMIFLITRTVLIFDHRYRRLRIVANAHVRDGEANAVDVAYDRAAADIESLLAKLALPVALAPLHAEPVQGEEVLTSNTTRAEYEAMVLAAEEFICAGDIFQIVLSQRFETALKASPLDLYRALRFVNPSPYMFCLNFGPEFSLVGSSPEVHVRAMDGNIEIRPIAGTRPRGRNEAEDLAHEKDLLADPKERAEHLMLVDLARNDVGRIAEFGSVKVTDFMTVERYSHVMHIVSNVVGKLDGTHNAYDVLRATFPAGTVSGSPKVRAMQIINELEKDARGPYAGAVAYFGFDGNLDSCITLRTVVVKEGKACVQAGAGVVADSTPEGEYQETVNKAMGMMKAIRVANESIQS